MAHQGSSSPSRVVQLLKILFMYLNGNLQDEDEEEEEEEQDAIVVVLVLFGFFANQSSRKPLTGLDIVTDLSFFIFRLGLADPSVRRARNM